MKITYAALLLTLLTGCASLGGGSFSQTLSFPLKNGSMLTFNKSGCMTKDVKFINTSDRSARVSGNVIVSNINENQTIDEYMLSCSTAMLGGSSACSMIKIIGNGGPNQYGGFGCPAMKFSATRLDIS